MSTLLKRLLCDGAALSRGYGRGDGTLKKRWFLPSTSFQSNDFCFMKDSGLPSAELCFLTQRPSGELEFAELSCAALGGRSPETGSDPVGNCWQYRLTDWLPGNGLDQALGSCSHGNPPCFQNNVSNQENSSQSLSLYSAKRLKAQRASF